MKNLDKRPRRSRPLAELIGSLSPTIRARRQATWSLEFFQFCNDLGMPRDEALGILTSQTRKKVPFLQPTRWEYEAAKEEVIAQMTQVRQGAIAPIRE